jgi:hypothetical protein
MAIANKADLQTKAASWLRRSGNATFVAEVPDFITIAEGKLNRELGPVLTDTTLTGTAASRVIDISALSVVRPVALFLAETGSDEREVQFKADGTFPYLTTSGRPSFVAIDGTNLNFDCPLSAAYPFRFRHQERFSLSISSSTNWLLTNHPDVYLAAVLMWGAGYLESWENGAVWKSTLDEGIRSVKSEIAQKKRSVLTVDPGLRSRGHYSLANWTSGV